MSEHQDQYCPYRGIPRWVINDPFQFLVDLSSVEGPIDWKILTGIKDSELESKLSFEPSHRDLKEFIGNWLIKGVVTFRNRETSELLLQVNFTCNQVEPVHTFDSTLLRGKESVLTMQYTQLVGMGVVPRTNYSIPTARTDVCLVVGKRRLHVSKAVLASYSDYFEAMFFGNFPESTKDEIEIKDISASWFIGLLDLCSGSCLIRPELVEGFLKLADRFAMPIAMQRIEAFLLVTDCSEAHIDNVRLLQIADQYKFTLLMTQVVSRFTLRDYDELMTLESSVVHSLSPEAMVGIMRRVKSLWPG